MLLGIPIVSRNPIQVNLYHHIIIIGSDFHSHCYFCKYLEWIDRSSSLECSTAQSRCKWKAVHWSNQSWVWVSMIHHWSTWEKQRSSLLSFCLNHKEIEYTHEKVAIFITKDEPLDRLIHSKYVVHLALYDFLHFYYIIIGWTRWRRTMNMIGNQLLIWSVFWS